MRMHDPHFVYERKWTLVTEASTGIWASFCYALASRAANLILVARSQEILHEIARDIRGQFQVETDVIAADLALPTLPRPLS